MSKKQDQLKESVKSMNDRELQETIAYFSNENEKHLKNISSILNWFFWIMILGMAIGFIVMILSAGPQSTPTNL